jgi:hypothetical protein
LGGLDEISRFSDFSNNIAMDGQGNLYTATSFSVERFTWSGTSWTNKTTGMTPIAFGEDLQVPSNPAVSFVGTPVPGFAVAALGNTTTPIVYLAGELVDAQGVHTVQVAAANSNDLSHWTLATIANPPGSLSSFRPALSVDGPNNTLDLLALDLVGSAGAAPQDIHLRTSFYRLDASHLSVFVGPVTLNAIMPAVSDLASSDSIRTIDTETGPVDNTTVLFPGDYVGVTTKALNAIAGWPELNTSTPPNIDLGLAVITTACSQPLSLIDPDSTWRCSCDCGLGATHQTNVVGCAAAAATTPALACAQVCAGSPCGKSLACLATACHATGAGTKVSANSCALSDGHPTGAAPAGLADFPITASGTSTAVIHAFGQTATTPTTGQAFVSVTTSPPVTGAGLEIALLDPHPADVFVGGSVNAQVRNITLVHRSRLQGTFTDSKHFRIDPRMAEFVGTLQTQPTGGTLSSPFNIIASNPAAMTGVLDLGAGTFSLDGVASDSSGNSLELHFKGTVTSRPPDSNNNGIIDAVDKCPGATVGPDRTPPKFTFVPPSMTISTCKSVNIGQATATDPCGVTITNNAPTVFPLGTTTVIWTAKDKAGNVATAAQTVTAVLGNDVSCCPVGTHIIVGTSNNDVLTGTSGSDCILGLGGQDRISGGGGNDFISGGDGDDTITGDDGNDRIYGGSGQDTISGGAGNDFIDGGDGDDVINGNDGDDTLMGGQGQDQLFGGAGNDLLIGGSGDDKLFGGDGNDVLVGGIGNDTLMGENGDDALFGQDGDDHLDGGTGHNTLDGGTGHNQCVDNGATLLICPAPRR